MELMIKDIIGSNIASDNEQGDLIFDQIVSGVDNHEKQIFLDFSDLKLITTAFLNNAIGKLYKKYSTQELKGLLKVKNIKNKNDLELLRLVVLNAIEMS
ncbi:MULTISPECIES: STAS-like domain-containing protein [Clostridium]|uniref:STAS-like domain-containing protein n=1 Tax=Clostridium TaxID=1485 RepID=UPI0025E33B10|nr:STAS-like domain-containing protein [uncultured Clostridium sp.]